MDKLATFYPAFEIESRSTDTLFRELCQPADYKKLDQGSWKEALVNRYGEMMAAAPNMRKLAARLINEGLAAKGYAGVDAEHVYFNTFTDGYKNSGDTCYRHHASQLKESYNLVDTAILDLFVNDWWNTWSQLADDRLCGVYATGKEAEEWGPSDKLPFSAQVVADILYYDKNLFNSYYYEFDPFWNQYADAFRDFLADSFLASALVQYRARLLTDEGFAVLRNFYYGNHPAESKIIKLDVYGYYASDILCIYLGTERMFLYLPGANMPFREFVSMKEMKAWITEQLSAPESRDIFARHFSLYDRSDGGSYYGVNSVLRFMAEGNSQWDPQTYILYKEQTYDPANDVFGAMRDQIRARTEADRNQKVPAADGRYRDYVLGCCELFVAQAQMPRMILPEAPAPFDMDASRTPLGLRSAWVVDPARLAEPQHAKGSRVDTDTFRAIELLRVATWMADGLKNYTRRANEIPAFASGQQAITARFGLTGAEQEALRPDDGPKLPLEGQPAQIRLVRLANDTQPLAVIGHLAGNQYKLLDTLTLAETEGQLISAVPYKATGKTYYTANGYFRGYLPFQPFRYAFEYLWSPAHFRNNILAGGTALSGVAAVAYDCLERIHTSVTLRQCQEAALELIAAAKSPAKAGDPPYKNTLDKVVVQVIKAFFPNGMELLQSGLLEELPALGAQAAACIYQAGIEEIAGQNRELTATLLRYARHDNVIPLRCGGFKGQLAEHYPYPPVFIMENMEDFNALSTRYFEQEPYRAQGLTDNRSVFLSALAETRRKGLLDACFTYEGKLFVGCSYEELVHTISAASCNQESAYSVHPLTLLRMLQDVSGNAADPAAGLIAKYALPGYYRSVTDRRLRTMQEIYHLTENFDFPAWDADYGDAFAQAFEPEEGETEAQTVQRQIGLLLAGRGCALPATAEGVGFFLDHLQAFTAAGVTCAGVTSLYREIAQEDIDMWLAEGVMTHRLKAMLLTLDEGQANGPFRRLLETARTGNTRVLALGRADGSAAEKSNGYTHLYFRGGTLLNALRQLEGKGKFVLFTHRFLMFSTPGLNAPLPGLTQCLHIPGAWIDAAGKLRYYADSVGRPVLTEATPWKAIDGHVLPVLNDAVDPADEMACLMPEDGKVLGLKVFTLSDIETPTPAARETLLKKTVSEADWPALKQDVDAIKNALEELVTQEATTGSREGLEANNRMEMLGYRPGNGVTLTWWVRGANDPYYSPYFHTAPTVLIGSNEYVVDPTHLQFIYIKDEGVIVLPVDDWASEICARAMALNPYLVYRMKSPFEPADYSPFVFIAPRVPE